MRSYTRESEGIIDVTTWNEYKAYLSIKFQIEVDLVSQDQEKKDDKPRAEEPSWILKSAVANSDDEMDVANLLAQSENNQAKDDIASLMKQTESKNVPAPAQKAQNDAESSDEFIDDDDEDERQSSKIVHIT